MEEQPKQCHSHTATSDDGMNDILALEREFERDAILDEYETDRDAILMVIKEAIRERRFQEAQEFVFKYRAATKTDENFKLLARMTAQGLDTEQRIAKVETVLEATPHEDYDTRMALYEQILRIDPNHEKYQAELEQCRQEKSGTDIQKATDTNQSNNAVQTFGKRALFIGICLFLFLILLWLFQI